MGPLTAPMPSVPGVQGRAAALMVTFAETALPVGGRVSWAGDTLGLSFLASSRALCRWPSGWSLLWVAVRTLGKLSCPLGGSSRGQWSLRRGRRARLSSRPQALVLKDGGAAGCLPTSPSVGAGVPLFFFGGVWAGEWAGRGCRLVGSLQRGGAGSGAVSSPEGAVGLSSPGRCWRLWGTGLAAEVGEGARPASSPKGGSGLSPVSRRCFSRPGLVTASGVQSLGPFWARAAAQAGTKDSTSEEIGLGVHAPS